MKCRLLCFTEANCSWFNEMFHLVQEFLCLCQAVFLKLFLKVDHYTFLRLVAEVLIQSRNTFGDPCLDFHLELSRYYRVFGLNLTVLLNCKTK